MGKINLSTNPSLEDLITFEKFTRRKRFARNVVRKVRHVDSSKCQTRQNLDKLYRDARSDYKREYVSFNSESVIFKRYEEAATALINHEHECTCCR